MAYVCLNPTILAVNEGFVIQRYKHPSRHGTRGSPVLSSVMASPATRPHDAVAGAGNRRRILLVSENGLYPEHLGGMEIRGRELVTHLQDTYEIALLTKRSLTSPDGSTVQLHIPRLESSSRAWSGRRVLRYVGNLPLIQGGRKRLKSGLSTLQPDLLYLHRFCSLHPVVVHDLLCSDRPVLAWFGDQHAALLSSFATGSWARRVALGISPLTPRARDRVTLVFNCQFLQQFYASLVEGYSNQFVIYDGVDVQRFRPASTPPDSARFVFLGRVAWDKGFLDFCRALAALPRHLIGGIEIIGDGPMLRQGLDILHASGNADLIGGVGASAHDEVPLRLQRGSILVNPSRDEGMPASVLEAMACGLAVIATTVGGTPEVVRHGETGLLIAPGDFAGLMAACRLLGENAELRQRLGANARALIASQYDVSMSFAATKRLIAKTIDRGGFVGQSSESNSVPAG